MAKTEKFDSFDDFFNSIPKDAPLVTAGSASTGTKQRETFPCMECSGTGNWVSPRGNKFGKCFACGGKGHFFTSYKDRAKNRATTKSRKARKLDSAKTDFAEREDKLIDQLRPMVDWNNFAASLVNQFDSKGNLSENQIAAARKMIAKCAATKATNSAEREKNTADVDLSAIKAMFDTAMASGLKRPKFRVNGFVISRAPDHGNNAGHLYVKTSDDEYQGKITPDHKFMAAYSAAPETSTALQLIAEDPKAAAVKYGRDLGQCACCGRQLTDPVSIENGIGPICAGNFGF